MATSGIIGSAPDESAVPVIVHQTTGTVGASPCPGAPRLRSSSIQVDWVGPRFSPGVVDDRDPDVRHIADPRHGERA